MPSLPIMHAVASDEVRVRMLMIARGLTIIGKNAVHSPRASCPQGSVGRNIAACSTHIARLKLAWSGRDLIRLCKWAVVMVVT
jgi:hypothetical protein